MKFFILLSLLLSGALAIAQTDSTKLDSLEAKDFYIDFTVPDITAFSILDIKPNDISKPGNVKEFAMGLANFVSETGGLRPGLAVEWAPFKTFNKNSGNWEAKDGNTTKFEFKNILISGATTSDSSNVRMAFGLKFSPIDKTNPLNDPQWVDSLESFFYEEVDRRNNYGEPLKTKIRSYTGEVGLFVATNSTLNQRIIKLADVYSVNSNRIRKLREFYDTTDLVYSHITVANNVLEMVKDSLMEMGLSDFYNDKLDTLTNFANEFADIFFEEIKTPSFSSAFSYEILKRKAEFKKKNWNKLAIQASGGTSFNSPDASIRNLNGLYYGGAFTIALPLVGGKEFKKAPKLYRYLRDNSQLITQVKLSKYFVQDSSLNNTIFAGGRLLIGNSDKRFSFEVGYVNMQNPLTELNVNGVRYTIGAEFKIMENYWLEFALGGQDFEDATGQFILPKFGFRHSFGNESRFFKK